MALGPFVNSFERSRVVRFSQTVSYDFDTFLLPRPEKWKDIGGFMRPFSYGVRQVCLWHNKQARAIRANEP